MNADIQDIIRVEHLRLEFQADVLFKDLSFRIPKRTKAFLTGDSGSGKSTLLKCLLGFQNTYSGTIYIKGEKLNPETIRRFRMESAYVPQEPDMGRGTVREILARPFTYHANKHLKQNISRIPELFDRFNLSGDLSDKDISALSGGEKQRVAVVSAVLLDRSIYLLDEVTSALDEKNRNMVWDFFLGNPDITVLAVTHEPPVPGQMIINLSEKVRHEHD